MDNTNLVKLTSIIS